MPSTSSPTRILPICGSLRLGSYNRKLLEAAAAWAPQGLSFEPLLPLDDLPYFDEDLEERGTPESVTALCRRVDNSDGLLIATPEYNQAIPGILKNALDWLSRSTPEVLEGKPVCVVGASPGPWGTRLAQSALRQLLYTTGALVLPPPAMFVANFSKRLNDREELVDERILLNLARLMSRFETWIELTGSITKWMKALS